MTRDSAMEKFKSGKFAQPKQQIKVDFGGTGLNLGGLVGGLIKIVVAITIFSIGMEFFNSQKGSLLNTTSAGPIFDLVPLLLTVGFLFVLISMFSVSIGSVVKGSRIFHELEDDEDDEEEEDDYDDEDEEMEEEKVEIQKTKVYK